MNKASALFYSYVFHPLLAPFYTFFLLLFVFPSNMSFYWGTYNKAIFLIAILLLTFLIPGAATYFLNKTRHVEDITLPGQKERILPLSLTIITYTITTIFCYRNIPLGSSYTILFDLEIPNVALIMALNTGVILAVYFINFFWKVSAHAAGMGGIVSYSYIFSMQFGAAYSYVMLFLVIISGFVLASRIRLESHTPPQTYVGFLIGSSITYLGGMYLSY